MAGRTPWFNENASRGFPLARGPTVADRRSVNAVSAPTVVSLIYHSDSGILDVMTSEPLIVSEITPAIITLRARVFNNAGSDTLPVVLEDWFDTTTYESTVGFGIDYFSGPTYSTTMAEVAYDQGAPHDVVSYAPVPPTYDLRSQLSNLYLPPFANTPLTVNPFGPAPIYMEVDLASINKWLLIQFDQPVKYPGGNGQPAYLDGTVTPPIRTFVVRNGIKPFETTEFLPDESSEDTLVFNLRQFTDPFGPSSPLVESQTSTLEYRGLVNDYPMYPFTGFPAGPPTP